MEHEAFVLQGQEINQHAWVRLCGKLVCLVTELMKKKGLANS
jgi:hypothetical protein